MYSEKIGEASDAQYNQDYLYIELRPGMTETISWLRQNGFLKQNSLELVTGEGSMYSGSPMTEPAYGHEGVNAIPDSGPESSGEGTTVTGVTVFES